MRAVLAVCLASVDKGLTLPAEMTGDPAAEDPAELQRLGIERLPESAQASLARLESSDLLKEVMGDWLFDAFTAVRRAEIALFAGSTPEQVVTATRWRY